MSPRRCLLTLLPVLASGCALDAGGSARYTGPAPACGRSEGGGVTAVLTRLGGGFAFAPYDGSLVIDGTVAPNGALAGAQALQPAKIGAEGSTAHAPARAAPVLSVTGNVRTESATVSYAAPGCSDTVTLARAHPPGLL